MKSILNLVGRFSRDVRGNIAMMFGLLVFVLLGGAGIAIDFQRSNLVRAEIHEATDAALLAAARYKSGHPNATMNDLTEVARKVFDNDVKSRSFLAIDDFAITFDSATETFALDVDAKIDTLIMGVLGQKFVESNTRSEAKLGKPPLLEVALALDVTGSMGQNGKINTMKTAARDLVTTLFDAPGADVKIGVVPFAQYVNIGTANGTKSWLSNPGAGWKGCVGSRDHPYNTQDSDYAAIKIPGLIVSACPPKLMALTTDRNALESMIGNLGANGSTYIPSGLAWAWRLLTPGEPFDEGLSFAELEAEKGLKVLILMTDGMNTKAPDYPTHDSNSTTLANQLTKDICVNIKIDKIVVYTIAFNVSDTTIKSILEGCATSSAHYFDAANSNELIDAFATIASSLRNLSLSK
jgi:Flp pilus assembly protein TadG